MEAANTTHTIAAQASQTDRMAFLRKVYNLLALSVITAAATCYLTVSSPGFMEFVKGNIIIFAVLYFVSIFGLMFVRKRETLGLLGMFVFTSLSGIMASIPVMMYQEHVVNAAVLSLLAFGGLSFYAVTTRKDFSFMGGFLMVGLFVLIIGGLLNAFWLKSSGFDFFMNIGGILLFSGLILFDTSRIMNQYSTDEYIMATVALYLDLLNLFLFILKFLGRRD